MQAAVGNDGVFEQTVCLHEVGSALRAALVSLKEDSEARCWNLSCPQQISDILATMRDTEAMLWHLWQVAGPAVQKFVSLIRKCTCACKCKHTKTHKHTNTKEHTQINTEATHAYWKVERQVPQRTQASDSIKCRWRQFEVVCVRTLETQLLQIGQVPEDRVQGIFTFEKKKTYH